MEGDSARGDLPGRPGLPLLPLIAEQFGLGGCKSRNRYSRRGAGYVVEAYSVAKSDRFRVAAVAGVDLKVYADHLRKGELRQMADAVGADLVELKGGGGQGKNK